MAWGCFKKIAIADNLAITVDALWKNYEEYAGMPMLLGAFFFGIQIYCDFSGYSDIARGSAKLFGIELSENFKSPYFSRTIKEFWNRWHISLSKWLKDYIYIPLGGSREGKFRYIFATIATFLVSGLWHGANWTFLIWGGIYAVALLTERMLVVSYGAICGTCKKYGGRDIRHGLTVLTVCEIVLTNLLVFLLWILFRSESIAESVAILSGICNAMFSFSKQSMLDALNLINTINPIHRIWLDILILFIFDFISLSTDVIQMISGWRLRWVLYVAIILFTYYQIPQTQNAAFLYFQF